MAATARQAESISYRGSYRSAYARGTQARAYVSGSAARELDPARRRVEREYVPVRRQYPEKAPAPGRSAERLTRSEIIRRRAARRAVKRNRERAFSMSPGYVVLLTCGVAVFGIFCVFYLYLQSQVTLLTGNISSLESQVAELRSENSTAQNRIQSLLGVDDVKESAGEMGMTTPDEDSVIYYELDDSDFVTQVGEVPSE